LWFCAGVMEPQKEPPDFSLAGKAVRAQDVAAALLAYPVKTLRYYDNGDDQDPDDEGPVREAVLMSDIGRMCVIEPSLSGADVVALVEAGRDAPFDAVAPDDRLEFADPEEAGGLYDRANDLYQHFFKIDGIKSAKASKLLHLHRPQLYPILDRWVKALYREAADEAAKASTTRSPNGEPMFWAAIREDLIVNSGSLLDLRHWCAEQHGAATARWSLLGGLTDLRLLDVLAWSVARTSSVR